LKSISYDVVNGKTGVKTRKRTISNRKLNGNSNGKRKSKRKLKVGLALGAGAARGLVHIGILKVLHKNKIYPDLIAGTSMGAVMGSLYAVGHTPLEIARIAKGADLKNIIDFTIPKSGILQGRLIEKYLRDNLSSKTFKELDIPLRVVSYNFTKKEKAVFSEGDVARAVRASISIPGIFNPTQIGECNYIDGVLADPTPFDVVRDMGADVIIAVDLYTKQRVGRSVKVQKHTLYNDIKKKFISEELFNLKNYLFPQRWPRLLRKFLIWIFDKILYPAKILRIMTKRELPEITKVMNESLSIVTNNFARERMIHSDVDFKITPTFNKLDWTDFNKVDDFIRKGERAMLKELPRLKKKLGIR
jgi:predicted acylesterase/phospholipase RssA